MPSQTHKTTMYKGDKSLEQNIQFSTLAITEIWFVLYIKIQFSFQWLNTVSLREELTCRYCIISEIQ